MSLVHYHQTEWDVSIVGTSVWNSIPFDQRSLLRDLSSSIYKLLKILLFGRALVGIASE